MHSDDDDVGDPVEQPLSRAPERAEFERWFSEAGKWSAAIERSGEGYRLAAAQSAWTAWQACWLRFSKEWSRPALPALPKPRVLASGTLAGKHVELRGWHVEDIEIWERMHGLKFGA